ncbi:MAG: hypothetical protein FWJ74_06385 [Gemmatimonadota bacterium]
MNDGAQLAERRSFLEQGPIDRRAESRTPSPPAWVVVGGVCALALVTMHPWVPAWGGDAVIHLRIAELFAQGRPFEYNPGEPVGASTSLLWTLLLAGFFRVLDPAAVAWAVKVVCFAAWYGTAVAMAACWSRLYGDRAAGLLAASAYALSPGIFRNATGGMEASFFALQLVLLFAVVFVPRGEGAPALASGAPREGSPTHTASPTRSERGLLAAAFALSATATLTRPEGLIFVTLLAGYLAVRDRGRPRLALGILAGAAVGVAGTVLANLYATGSPIPDSAVARLATGLRASVRIGPLHADLRSVVLLLGYLPFTLGLVFGLSRRLASAGGGDRAGAVREGDAGPTREGDARPAPEPWRAPVEFTLVLTAALLVFYTFVAGAAHASRYWLPFYPFVFGAGSGTLVLVFRRLRREGWSRTAVPGAVACLLWLAAFYAADAYRRRGAPIGHPHGQVAAAVRERPAFTERYLRELGVTAADPRPVSVAVTEVQVRYFLADDGSVRILSLDGRTGADFGRYLDPETGLRRFDLYLREVRPDFVELGQFDPAEPVLPAVLEAWERGEERITVDGFEFRRTGIPYVVRFVHEP